MSDLISRQAAIDILDAYQVMVENGEENPYAWARLRMNELPSEQPEVKEIGYAECANAMLKMWIDNVLTDGEYNRIMDKLNKHEMERRKEDE